ncbi:DUF1045 domain-containing protein [Planktotalea sp.]|uniref:DUF1045 domain-containing protein n=1 Tax=Planktotalea sp. TaxID=2029877 RepID=UPI0035C85DC2
MFERYAVYYTFDGALGAAGADWLGWDIVRATAIRDAREETKRPRKYGFHATLKAPFQLAQDRSEAELRNTFSRLCTKLTPITLEGLQIQSIGRFLALTAEGDTTALMALEGTIVRELDAFRAPLTKQERIRRLNGRLNAAQLANVERWGYPHVMEQFQFHATLTAPLNDTRAQLVRDEVTDIFTPLLPRPFHMTHLTLAGQRRDGFFEQIVRAPMSDAPQH